MKTPVMRAWWDQTVQAVSYHGRVWRQEGYGDRWILGDRVSNMILMLEFLVRIHEEG